MKTHEEIKKGLECCSKTDKCHECPYIREAFCATKKDVDALAYIQQLEEQNAELVRKIDKLQSSMGQVEKALQNNGFGSLEEFLQAFSQVKRERDAAVKDISLGSRCAACKMFFHNGGRCSGGIYCIPMNFEWRGVPKKEEEHEADSD